MPHRINFLLATVLLETAIGCATLKDQLTKDDASPAGSTVDPSSTQPGLAAGLDPGWELAPSATYTATHSGEDVTIKALGEHTSAGYETKLVQSPLRIWPPQWLLAVKPPDGPAATVMTPFEATASFKAKEPVEMVSVRDARGLQKVPVQQAKPATGPSPQPTR